VLPEGSALPRRRLAPGDVASPARWPRGVSALLVVTGALTLLYLASTILRAAGTSSFFFDVVIANLGYAGCTALCGWRAFARSRGRWGWGALAAGLLMFTSGSVLWTTWVQYFHPVPYPSIADGCFLTFFLLAFIGIALLVRETVPRTSKTIWVDGVIAALGVAALETTLVISPIAYLNSGSPIIVATNLAYPIGDLVLVTMVVAVFAVRGWRPGRLWWLLGLGLVVFAAADSVYVLRVLSNTYVTGTPLDSLWLIGALFMSFAAWQRMGTGLAARNLPTVEAPNIIPVVFLLT
jgi:diguanylate cyclase